MFLSTIECHIHIGVLLCMHFCLIHVGVAFLLPTAVLHCKMKWCSVVQCMVHVYTCGFPLSLFIAHIHKGDFFGMYFYLIGVQFLSPTAVLTTSIDQRLNVWEITNRSLAFVWGMVHDIADTAALKVLQTIQW